ncbi:MAG TPA: DUF935 domain-containing protein [Hyphomonas sp.]|nr:DUF935 domain-containing protein [Hyphomonas sp.]
MRTAQLLDHRGNPVQRSLLKTQVAVPTTTGLRNPMSGYPGDGLNPVRLASILREADMGNPIRFFELAETIEERDLHYVGVLGTRRRSVSQIDITVEPASDKAEDVDRAAMVTKWLKRDELSEEVFDILDCIGKGISFTEIIWDTSEGQWQPQVLEWSDPRWFGVDRLDLRSPTMRTASGADEPLPAFKFIGASIKAKSGLPLRSGLSRIAMWAYLFKKFTERDWAIFTQTYGQPLRLGKWGAGASEADKETLFQAVANIAGDCAAIIPASMEIEFVQTGSVGASAELYKERADWLDQQVSKCVLGQTATTDAVTGGLGSGKEHRQVQEDIERADAKALAAILNRDLIRPWMQLNFGSLPAYPRLVIARPEAVDIAQLSSALAPLIDRGLKVSSSDVRSKFGLPEPAPDAEVLAPEQKQSPPEPPAAPLKGLAARFEGGKALLRVTTALASESASGGPPTNNPVTDAIEQLSAALEGEAAASVEGMIDEIEVMLETAGALAEFREMLMQGFPSLDTGELSRVMALALLSAWGAGRVAIEEEAGD